MRNDEDFRGILLVRKDSGITSLEQLRGRKISYPAPTALAATMMPQWLLHQNGLQVGRDVESVYVGSQESSIMNVYLGQTAAAATWPAPWRALARERPEVAEALEVRWQTGTLPNNALVARNDVPDAVVARLRAFFVNLDRTPEGRALLASAEIEGFEAASDETYAPVRDFLARFEVEVRRAGDP
jgi:phosphonate transport system substrate-binding protein